MRKLAHCGSATSVPWEFAGQLTSAEQSERLRAPGNLGVFPKLLQAEVVVSAASLGSQVAAVHPPL